MLFFFKTENEENVLICLRIIIELHKQFRPPITQEVSVYPHSFYKACQQVALCEFFTLLELTDTFQENTA